MSKEDDVVKSIINGEENSEQNIEEDDERLKGDAIGDTLYSESWILKTLMKLTQVKFHFTHTGKGNLLYLSGIAKLLKET